MIVVIDDERTFAGADLHLRRSAEALAWLANLEPCSELWFDHDLGGDDTTRAVALWLAEMAFNEEPYPVERVFVHSMNPVGRAWLVSTPHAYGARASALPTSG